MFELPPTCGVAQQTALRWLAQLALLGTMVLALPATAADGLVNAQDSGLPDATSPLAPFGMGAPSGPVRLNKQQQATPSDAGAVPMVPAAAAAAVPGEFEQFVQRSVSNSTAVQRLGAALVTGAFDGGADLSPLVPPDYLVAAGDEVLVTLWGSVDADLRLRVDRAGRVAIPRVGVVQVAGVRYADLQGVIERRAAQVFKNFQVSVTLGQLRGIRVFVTGFVPRPGSYSVSSLATAVTALMRAGGPTPAGSFRNIEIRRGGQLVSTLDLYDLLTKGDRSADRTLQGGDVVHVQQVGVEVGVVGSVNRPAVVELKTGESLADALRFAGGFSAIADRSRLVVERLADRKATRVVQVDLPEGLKQTLGFGDVVVALSAVDKVYSKGRPNKRVRVEGEVNRPGEYVMPEGTSMADAVRLAGGYTSNAYLYAADFTRESVRVDQQLNYERALRDLETEFARTSASQRIASSEEAGAVAARNLITSRLIERLRSVKPTGRVVLQMKRDSPDLPDIALEDGDRLYVPPTSSTVGVFGSVFNAASYLYSPDKAYEHYLRLAGGTTKGADDSSVFVIRANGEVVSARQSAGFFKNGDIGALKAAPGDTIFVPEETLRTTFVQGAKDWTQILYQFGLGVAGLRILR